MTALSTESRQALVTAFEGHGIRVYDTPPAVPKPPAVVIIPDAPWIVPERIGTPLNYRVRWKVLVVISPRNNEAATIDIEDAVDTILALVPSTFNVEQVNPPQLNDVGAQGTVLTTEINISAHWKE
jgi:hypothetical protein